MQRGKNKTKQKSKLGFSPYYPEVDIFKGASECGERVRKDTPVQVRACNCVEQSFQLLVCPFYKGKSHLFSLHLLTESLEACTPTFPNQSPHSQMYWEGTQIPCLPNIIIPVQAGAAWKSTFKAH